MSRYSLKKSTHDEGVNTEKPKQGFYTFQITDYKEKDKDGNWLKTKNGDPKIGVICEVCDESSSEFGKSLFHSVIFYNPTSPSIKGIGITRHFLKCIDEPWEGDLDANPDKWIGKRFQAEVIHVDGYANLVEIQSTTESVNAVSTKPENNTKPDSSGDVNWDD